MGDHPHTVGKCKDQTNPRWSSGKSVLCPQPMNPSPLPPSPAPPDPGNDPMPSLFQKKVVWMALTGLAMLGIGVMVVYVIYMITEVLRFLQTVLVPLAFAGILAYLLDPLIKRLIRRGTPRFRAMLWVFTLFHLLMLFLFLSIVVPTIAHVGNWAGKQNRETIAASLAKTADEILGPLDKLFAPQRKKSPAPPSDIKPTVPPGETKAVPAPAPPEAQPLQESWWREWLNDPEHSGRFAEKIPHWFDAVLSGFLGVFGYLVGFIMVPFYLYYFLKDAESIRTNWDKFLPLRKSEFKTQVVAVLNEINGYLIAFFRGTMLVSLIDGALVGLSLTLIGLPYAPLLGLCVAFLGLLPYVGTILCWGAAIAISIIHFGVESNRWDSLPHLWAYPLIVTVIFALVMKINALVTAPKIIGEAVGLHPLTVIFSVLFWSLLLGPLLGALLAVPLSASVKVLFRRYIWERSLQQKLTPGDAEVGNA